MPHFTVAICTAKRPAMLATARESIVNLAVPDHGTLSVVVVENDLKPSSRDVIKKIRATTAVPIKHCLEPRIGIHTRATGHLKPRSRKTPTGSRCLMMMKQKADRA